MEAKLTKAQIKTLNEIRSILPDGGSVDALEPFPRPTVRALFRHGALARVPVRREFGCFGVDRFVLASTL